MALAKRLIETTITLVPPDDPDADIGRPARTTFAESGTDTVKLSGLRASCHITKAGGPADCTMSLRMYGMTKSKMNDLSTLGMQINLVPKNKIVVTAGDVESGMGTVFAGYIMQAFADFQGAPDVSFNIVAHTGLPDAVIPAPVASYRGSADVAVIMSDLATKMGLSFENNGVTTKLSNQYLYGSLKSQARQAVQNAGIEWNNGDNGVLAIWPKNGSRGGQVPIVSPQTGLIGYPTYTAYGLMLRTLFNPSIGFGSKIEVRSSLEPANGEWSVYHLDHDLESLIPRGRWYSTIGAYNPKFPPPIIAPAANT